MDEKKVFQKAIRKINHARKKEGRPQIQYAVDFGESVHVSQEWSKAISPIIRLLQDRRNQYLSTYLKSHSQ